MCVCVWGGGGGWGGGSPGVISQRVFYWDFYFLGICGRYFLKGIYYERYFMGYIFWGFFFPRDSFPEAFSFDYFKTVAHTFNKKEMKLSD